LVVITNQPDIGHGLIDISEINIMHEFLKKELPIDDIEICPHIQSSNCECRKPKAGLIFSAVDKYNINLGKSWLIGDRWSDIVAGVSLGLKTIFIDHNYTEPTKNFSPDYVVSSINKACGLILNE
jgi:D-glycero-D-manno-heptose 1,7-bisphosphate phosphatase